MDTDLIKEDTGTQEHLVKMRSVNGTVYFITCSNPSDYVLHPEFLRFAVVSCLVYALAHGDADVPGLTGWPFLAVWTMVLIVILLWLALCGRWLRHLHKNKLSRPIWTPFLLLPMNLLIEASVQGTMFLLVDKPFKPWGTTLADLTRDFAVLLLLDFLHGHYVVSRHPLARVPGVRSTEEVTQAAPYLPSNGLLSKMEPEQRQNEAKASTTLPDVIGNTPHAMGVPGPVAGPKQNTTVLIGAQTFTITEILMIRIEDHYLSVTTRSGRSIHRAKLAAIELLHKGYMGIQINRSVWVAFWAIREIQPAKNGQILLILANGDEELVAKPRVYAFRQSYRAASNGGA